MNEIDEIRAELVRLGHPCTPDEPVIEKVRNLCAVIQSQKEILERHGLWGSTKKEGVT